MYVSTCQFAFPCAHVENTAYVLDLRSEFPSECDTSPDNVAWRERILGLERDLGYLQMKYNKERISKCMIGVATNSCTQLPSRDAMHTDRRSGWTLCGVYTHHPNQEAQTKTTPERRAKN
jgi:hypothetical protein